MPDRDGTPTAYFEGCWAGSADPWDHAGRWYEARKYDLTVAALPAARYRHAVEPACGAGVLTTRLAARADRVSATDRFPAAVAATRQRCRELGHVTVSVADVRDGPPTAPYDLAVLSECLYYFPPATVADLVRRWHAGAEPGGHVVVVHHRPVVAEHVLTGDEVHAIVADVIGEPAVRISDAEFRLDVVAAAGGEDGGDRVEPGS